MTCAPSASGGRRRSHRDLRHHLFRPPVWREIGSVRVEQRLEAAPAADIEYIVVSHP
jgi:hypothetical protein